MSAWDSLRAGLLQPEGLAGLSLRDWDALLRVARPALLLPSLEAAARGAGVLEALPGPVRAQLAAARVLAEANERGMRWEIDRLRKALAPLGLPLILLKGAAYAAAGLPPARGRLCNDVDILVPAERLDAVEQALFWQGWGGGQHDAYDQRYYRQWMHELPPLQHQKRQSVLDVHHSILPPTARYHPDPAKLRAAAAAVPDLAGVQILAPADLVLHSACHLFHEGEWQHGLRDLYDLDRLLRHYGAEPAYWEHLAARALELELRRPLFYALRHAERIWQTPVPPAVFRALAPAKPPALALGLMDALLRRAFRPDHALTRLPGDGAARFCLYLRGHWLRMPAHLLIPHLLRKAFKPLAKTEVPA